LPNYGDKNQRAANSLWAEVREAQAMTLSLPKTGMAVSIDVGEADNIHPKNKLPVGQRLALVALHQVYGKDVECSGPTYVSMTAEQSSIRLKFNHAIGLAAKATSRSASRSPAPTANSPAPTRQSTAIRSWFTAMRCHRLSLFDMRGQRIPPAISTTRPACPPYHFEPMTGLGFHVRIDSSCK